jgi:hypothetical protein
MTFSEAQSPLTTVGAGDSQELLLLGAVVVCEPVFHDVKEPIHKTVHRECMIRTQLNKYTDVRLRHSN